MVQGSQTLVKYLLFFFNFLFVVTGIALIALGAVVKARASEFIQYLGHEVTSTSIFLIIIGVIIFFIAFLGCCGAIKENYCMVMTFAVLLFIIFIMEFAAGIAAFVFKGKLHDVVDKNMKSEIVDYNNTKSWDDLQSQLKCCGSTNYTDWQLNPYYKNHTDTYPQSCCKDIPHNGTECTLKYPGFYKQGCLTALEDQIDKNIGAIGGAGIGIAFVEVVGIIFSCCLARAIKKEYETV